MSCSSPLTNLFPFYDGDMTGAVDKGRAGDVVCLDFMKAFDTLSHTPLITELVRYGLDKWKLRWAGKLAQVISDAKSSRQPITSSVPQRSILFNVFGND